MSARVGSNEWWLAGIAAVWSCALLLTEVPAVAWLGLGWGAVVLVHRAWPVPAVLGAALLWGASALAGVPETNAAALLPMVIVYFGAGRHLASRWWAGLVLAGLAPLALGPWEAGIPGYVFAALLYAASWGAGRVLRHRAGRAAQAWAVTRSLARTPPGRAATDSGHGALDPLGELTDRFFADVQEAIGNMRRAARDALPGLDPEAIGRIMTVGAATVAELKDVVVSLRKPPELHLQAPPSARPGLHSWWPAAGYPLLAGLLVFEVAIAPAGFSLRALAVGLLMVAACVAGRRWPVAGALALAVLLAATVWPGVPLPEGLSTATVYSITVWRLAAAPPRQMAALLPFLAALGLALWHHAPGNIPINLGTLAVVVVAARTWLQHTRDEEAARSTADRLREEFTTLLNTAVASEGLALSGLVHDATSHSVGVLLMQANAASALAATDPAGARRALELVESVGAQAQQDLAGLAAEKHRPLRRHPREELTALLARLSGTGIEVALHRSVEPGARLAPVLYKVAAEAVFNAARHAPGSKVSVKLQASAWHSEVEVSNSPSTGKASSLPGSGQGLSGLEQELAALGGSLVHGPTAEGGFRLRAVVPSTKADLVPGLSASSGGAPGNHAQGGTE